jgi:hypothetical protein
VRASGYNFRVNRLAAIGLVVLAGCSKKHGAPAKQEPAAAPAPVGDPAAAAKEAARAEGVMGHTTDGFGDTGEGGNGPGSTGAMKAKGQGEPQPVVGGGAPAGVLTLGKVVLAGKGDGAAVTAALTKRLDELQACYQDALGTKPALTGQLTLAFTIKPDGSLDAVTASASTLKDESLETCLTDSAKSARLEKPLGTKPVKGTIVIDFRPS